MCRNYHITDNRFKGKVNSGMYSIRGSFSYNSPNIVYIISSENWETSIFVQLLILRLEI